jgi:hypothetical protein
MSLTKVITGTSKRARASYPKCALQVVSYLHLFSISLATFIGCSGLLFIAVRTEFAYKLDLPDEEMVSPSPVNGSPRSHLRSHQKNMCVFVVGYAADAVDLTMSKMKFLNGIGYAIYVSAFDLDEQILDVSGSDLDAKLIGPTDADTNGAGTQTGTEAHAHKKKVLNQVTLVRPAAPFSKNSPYRRNKHSHAPIPTVVDELADAQVHAHDHKLTLLKTASMDSTTNGVSQEMVDNASISSADSLKSPGPPLSQLLLIQHQRQLSNTGVAASVSPAEQSKQKQQTPNQTFNSNPVKKESIFAKMRTSSDSYSDTNSDASSTESDADSVNSPTPRELIINTLTKQGDGNGPAEQPASSKVVENAAGTTTPLGMPPTGFKRISTNTQVNSAQTISANFAAAMNITRTPSPQMQRTQEKSPAVSPHSAFAITSPSTQVREANAVLPTDAEIPATNQVASALMPVTHVSRHKDNGGKHNNKEKESVSVRPGGTDTASGEQLVRGQAASDKPHKEKHAHGKKLKYWVPSWEPLDVWAFPVAELPILTRVPSNLTLDLFSGLRHIGDGCNSNIFLGYYKDLQVVTRRF